MNNLTSTDTNKPLSAAQGKALNTKITNIGSVKTFTRTQTSSGGWVFGANATGLTSGTYLLITYGYGTDSTSICQFIGKSYNEGDYCSGTIYVGYFTGTAQNTNAFINGTINFVTITIRLA